MFERVWKRIQEGKGSTIELMDSMNFEGIHTMTALVIGGSPIEALIKDCEHFSDMGSLPKVIASEGYRNAWTVATNSGRIFDKMLQLPVGMHWDVHAKPQTTEAIALHPVVILAKTQRKILPSQIRQPVLKGKVAAYLGKPVSSINTRQTFEGEVIKSTGKPLEIVGTLGGATAGFFVAGPVGAVAGAIFGWLGSREVKRHV